MTNSIEDREAWIADCRKRHADALRYQGNPLIEALPLPWDKDKLIDRFGNYPKMASILMPLLKIFFMK